MPTKILTDTAIKKARAKTTPVKLTDGGGLYLHIAPTGGKLWRYKYRFQRREKLMSFGAYPEVSLAQARKRHEEARTLLADGTDPMEQRKTEKTKREANGATFTDLYQKWFENWKQGKDEKNVADIKARIEADILPAFGSKPVDDVDANDVRLMILNIEKRGAREISKRAHAVVRQIYGFGIPHQYARRNPASDFKFSDLQLPQVEMRHRARIDEKELPALLKAMDSYDVGGRQTHLALQLMCLTFVRTSELLGALWTEFDLDNARWDIPVERLKKIKGEQFPHIVPLSRQAIKIIRALKALNGMHTLVFPGVKDRTKPLAINTLLIALKRMGYKHEMTGHGYRGLAGTILAEEGRFDEKLIDVQLAHHTRGKVRAAYIGARYLPERAKMMQWWGDYLDKQRKKAR